MSDLTQMLDADVLTLGMAADEARRAARRTNVVTYLRVHVIDDGSTPTVIPEHAAEVRLYGAPATFEAALAQVRAVRQTCAGRRLAAYSAAELEARGWMASDALRALVDAGAQDVAELPVDQLADVSAAIAALRDAGANPRRITTSRPIGDRRLEIIDLVRRAVERHPGAWRYAPLPRIAPIDKPTTGYDDVRMVALARLALGAVSIEVDWRLYGPKLAQVALTFGADHLDSVLAENDTALGPRRATVEDVERNIRAAGFEPQEDRPVA